ncbi:MAG: alpha/beta fold hydrolase [Vicinamibacterales bacterium]
MQSHDAIRGDAVRTLYQDFAGGRIDRREFMRRSTALGIAGAAAAALGPLAGAPASAAGLAAQAAAPAAGAEQLALDLAEWSYLWVNVKRADTARGSFVGGQQMYVEYMVPARVTKPFAIVLVHGGGGQGLDWMGTPDGRPGWFQYLAAEGYRVYVVDRPGHGRSPNHPDLHGGLRAQSPTMEGLQGNFIPPAPTNTDKYRRQHTQWPGPGTIGSPEVAQFIASQGGSYVVQPQRAGGGGGGRQGGAPGGVPTPANQQPEGAPNVQHLTWREAGAELLDTIGPAIIMTHSAGGSFGLIVAEARPDLVKATVMIEGGGSGFAGGNRWGMSTIPVTWDPPVADPSEIKTRWVANPEPDVPGYFLQEGPARQLPKLRNVAVLTVTAPASNAAPGNPGAPAFLKQAGVRLAEELRIGRDAGLQGNSHMMMVEKNHRQVLQPILDWLDRHVNTAQAPAVRKRGTESTAMKLANMGYFWVGAETRPMPYGTTVAGQMYVQYFIPQEIRHPLPVVLVHGGGGQGTDYMGIDGNASWAHYYVQAGYQLYLVDRPGHGRSPFMPDFLGEMGNVPFYRREFNDGATGTPRRWAGTGLPGDPLLDQFMAGQNAAPRDNALAQRLWRSRGAELLDRIGPAIIQTHSAGGPFGWVTADERPNLVKAIVCYEGGANPILGQGNAPGTRLNLQGIPVLYWVAENSGRTGGAQVAEALRQSGAAAEYLNLKDRGITGNSHFSMLENNRKEIFEVFRGWIESKVPATGASGSRA